MVCDAASGVSEGAVEQDTADQSPSKTEEPAAAAAAAASGVGGDVRVLQNGRGDGLDTTGAATRVDVASA